MDRCATLEGDFNYKFDKAKDNMDKTVKQASESFALQFTRKDENNLLFRTIENNYKVKFEEFAKREQEKMEKVNLNNECRLQKAESRANTSLILGSLAMISSIGLIIYNQM
jgi:isopenicillin N synthase-like dioxygenase